MKCLNRFTSALRRHAEAISIVFSAFSAFSSVRSRVPAIFCILHGFILTDRSFNEDDGVLLYRKTKISPADIKLKAPPSFSSSLSLAPYLVPPLPCNVMCAGDRFLAYNILSLVANREETKSARPRARGSALSRRRYLRLLRSLSLFLSPFPRVFIPFVLLCILRFSTCFSLYF